MRRANLPGATLPPRAIPEIITTLERALPMYIADAGRRSECLGRLRKLVHDSAAPVAPPKLPAPARGPQANGLPSRFDPSFRS